MEKIDVGSFPKFQGDFELVSEEYAVGGAGEPVLTKKGKTVDTFVLVRIKDGLVIRLFADQLRQEGGKLLASRSALQKQVARAETFKTGKQSTQGVL